MMNPVARGSSLHSCSRTACDRRITIRSALAADSYMLFKNRSFAAGLMFTFGVVLLGTTVLIPQFLQSLMGYTAEKAGEVLSPGAIAVLLMLPFVGFLLKKTDARYLIAFGMAITGVAMFHMTNFTLDMDFRTAVLWRVFQASGLAFLFVPLNTISYTGVPEEQNNQVSE